jgi:hypothetical protein
MARGVSGSWPHAKRQGSSLRLLSSNCSLTLCYAAILRNQVHGESVTRNRRCSRFARVDGSDVLR